MPSPTRSAPELRSVALHPRVLGGVAGLWLLFFFAWLAVSLATLPSPGALRTGLAIASTETVGWVIVGSIGMIAGWFLPVGKSPSAGQFAGLLALSLALLPLRALAMCLMRGRPLDVLWQDVLANSPRALLLATTYVGAGWGLRSLLAHHAQRSALAAAEAGLAEARFASARSWIRPRLLLRCMETIEGRIHDSPARADDLLVEMSEMLRLQLERSRRERVSVVDEVDFVRRLVAIEEHCQGRPVPLRVGVDERARALAIPPNSVAMLVEEALQHGAASIAGLALDIAARTTAEGVGVQVIVSRPGLSGAEDLVLLVPARPVDGAAR